MQGLRRVGKIAWRQARIGRGLRSDFAHAVEPPDETAWALRSRVLVWMWRLAAGRNAHPTAQQRLPRRLRCPPWQRPNSRSPESGICNCPTAVGDLPDEEFVDPACGTNGGPPGLQIGTFERFARCRPEPSGLREIWFRYDDEWEFIARAARDPDAVARNNAMIVLGQPVTLSLLIDAGGRVQGYRIFTDPRAEEEVRSGAYGIAIAFKARFGTEGWTCQDLPAAEGETPIFDSFVKESCRKVEDGLQVTTESRHYYKPGQAMLDPNTGLPTVNQFESSARLEVVRTNALPK